MTKEEIQRKIDINKKNIRNLRAENAMLEREKKETLERERIEKYSTKIRALYQELSILVKDIKKSTRVVAENSQDEKEANAYAESVETEVDTILKRVSIEESVEELINNPSTTWLSRSGYKQTESDFECPDCGEKLDLRIFDGGRVLLTCNRGYRKTGCKYGYMVKRK